MAAAVAAVAAAVRGSGTTTAEEMSPMEAETITTLFRIETVIAAVTTIRTMAAILATETTEA